MTAGDAPDVAVLQLDHELDRYDVTLLVDGALQDRVRTHGFAVLDPVVDDSTLVDLRSLADEFVARLAAPCGDEFLTVGRIEDLGLRAEMIRRAGELVLPSIAPLFVDDARFLSAAIQVKPPSPRSALSPHQDSSLVDERNWPGIYAWVPLVDTDVHNGGLQVVPGSHRIPNRHRTLSVPWQFAGCEPVLERVSVPLTVRAGGVVLFDSATVHSSPPNHSDRIRFALNNFARPAGAELLHFHQDADTSPGLVEMYEITPEFLFSDDIMARPGPAHRFVGEVPHHRVACDPAHLEDLCRSLLDEYRAAA